jgi:hypothetical protein
MTDEYRIETAIYVSGPGTSRNVNELDYGALVAAITEDRWILPVPAPGGGHSYEDGTVTVTARRTHEWELILGLVIAGSGAYFAGALQNLGEKTVEWVVDQAKKRGAHRHPEVALPQGSGVKIDPGQPQASIPDVANLLEQAARQHLRVHIIIEPAS